MEMNWKCFVGMSIYVTMVMYTLEYIYFVENGARHICLKFQKQDYGYWLPTSDHLCILDLYQGTYEIKFVGLGAYNICISYNVKGLTNDFVSVTAYYQGREIAKRSFTERSRWEVGCFVINRYNRIYT
jgi:Family of unknown function (DUF6314)